MDADERDEQFRRLSYSATRVPRLDALEAFVPTGREDDETGSEARKRPSRWFPAEGGHRVLVLYEGGEYDAGRWRLVKGGWDHEHCTRCGRSIEPMTLCWVTAEGPWVLLCEACHQVVGGAS